MVAFVLVDASISINGVDLSDHAMSVTLNYGADLQADTSMGDLTMTRLSGLIDWSVEVNFKQDFDAMEIDATLFALVGGPAIELIIKPTSAVVSATNPSFTGDAVIESYPPLGNAVGELAQVTATFQSAGTLVRAVA